MNGYDLSRNWFNWCFENPELVRPIHSAIYFFAIEHCNRLGWKDKFGFPTSMAMEALGIKKWHTYINALNDLIEWKFIKLIEKSKNQYSSNIITIISASPKNGKALDKALSKHRAKQGQSTGQSKVDIYKQETKNKKQYNYNKILLSEIKISDLKEEHQYYFEIAISFYKLFEKNLMDAGASTVNLKKAKGTWVNDIRLILENDKYSKESLRDVFEFLQKDEFWKTNILSISKLRKQLDQLLLKIKQNGNKTSKSGATNRELAEMFSNKFGADGK